MSPSTSPPPRLAGSNLAKGSVLRGYLIQLRRRERLEAVRRMVSPTTAGWFDEPPLPTTWIDATALEEIYAAVAAIDGEPAVASLVRDALEGSIGPSAMPILRGILRVFGAKPASLFERMDLVFRASLQGIAFRWSPTGARAGEVEVGYVAHSPPPIAFVAWQATLAYGFELCGVPGEATLVAVEQERIGRFAVRW
jgi:hypothetical protein